MNYKNQTVKQESDIPVKLIKENVDTISSFVYNNFSNF